jgi:hypothetical protein
MVIDMNDAKLKTLAQLKAFLDGSAGVAFQPAGDDRARYEHIGAVLRRFGYRGLGRADKGLVRGHLAHTTGYSRAQVTRLLKRALKGAPLVKRYCGPAHGFARLYTEQDVVVLAQTDTLHGTLSGPATKRLLVRALEIYGDTRYARLARISVAHLYNLRGRASYRDRRRQWDKTRPTPVAIGIRKAPQPEGRPGFIRIDSVHQGHQDGLKGLYHINAVDCVTQWQLVATCEKLSEAYLLPVIEALLATFPFRIEGFHADNGSEYINHQVAQMLEKLLVEATQVTPAPLQRQRLGGNQERRCGAQAPGLQPHPAALRRRGQRLLPGLSQPLPELPSALFVRRGDRRCQGQAQEALPLQRGHDAAGEARQPARTRALPQSRYHALRLAARSNPHQRQRGCTAPEPGACGAVSIHQPTTQTLSLMRHRAPCGFGDSPAARGSRLSAARFPVDEPMDNPAACPQLAHRPAAAHQLHRVSSTDSYFQKDPNNPTRSGSYLNWN